MMVFDIDTAWVAIGILFAILAALKRQKAGAAKANNNGAVAYKQAELTRDRAANPVRFFLLSCWN